MSSLLGTRENLPPAACELGYTVAQLESILGDRLGAFNHWMRGQTGGVCEGRRYDHEKKAYEPTGCGPHGFTVYGHDLRRFLARLPIID